jgi:hypothetical protein
MVVLRNNDQALCKVRKRVFIYLQESKSRTAPGKDGSQ